MRWLDANAENLTGLNPRNGLQDLRNEGLKIWEAVGLGEHEDNGHTDGREVLLMWKIAVHRDEDVEIAQGPTQEFSILQTAPTLVTNGRDIVGPEFAS
jgi:hypothetical protein